MKSLARKLLERLDSVGYKDEEIFRVRIHKKERFGKSISELTTNSLEDAISKAELISKEDGILKTEVWKKPSGSLIYNKVGISVKGKFENNS